MCQEHLSRGSFENRSKHEEKSFTKKILWNPLVLTLTFSGPHHLKRKLFRIPQSARSHTDIQRSSSFEEKILWNPLVLTLTFSGPHHLKRKLFRIPKVLVLTLTFSGPHHLKRKLFRIPQSARSHTDIQRISSFEE
ncbi:uncharacterized protein LOC121596117 isoform X3 [Anopheles merus]|uniref:uncharacterized protein LOC121596117 isoform X3 n=1 Tax=Anopheles merus TaxID=30066 RepID=UPI001BE434BE|nr:uncharacterized protein LOC121596117 isoform X3 [Anopheles merus]